MTQKTVMINGTVYDAHTGLPLDTPVKPQTIVPASTVKKAAAAHTVHTRTQKSTTLNRAVVKKAPAAHHVSDMVRRHSAANVQKSPHITKFAPHPAGARIVKSTPDVAPTTHPLQHHVNRVQASQKPAVSVPKPSHVIKNEAIENAMKHAPAKKQSEYKKPKRSRFTKLASVSMALLLLAGYFTYINMPNLSVRVASSQAGIAASYPDYKPDGYSLSGPVAYSDGEVSMKFASNSGTGSYTVSESKSSWDSSAVRDNYIRQNGGVEPTTHTERGLTIYMHGSNAAWVNRGILYTIKGDAPLSSEQIRRIATSL